MSEYLGVPIVTTVLSFISMACCSFVIYIYATFKELRSDQFTIVLMIVLFDLIYEIILFTDAVGYFFLQNSDFILSDKPVICEIQSFFSVYSVLSSTIWTSIITHSLYVSLLNQENQNMTTYYPAIGFIVPLIISIIPIIIDAYGQYYPMPQTNCFFDIENPHERLYKLLFFDFPIWIMFIFNIVVVILVIRIITKHDMQLKSLYSLFMYPMILAICWIIPGIVNQFEVTSQIWQCINFGLGSLIGFFDSYWYCYSALIEKISFKKCQIKIKYNHKSEEQELQKV